MTLDHNVNREVMTLEYAYVLWWEKPLNIVEPINVCCQIVLSDERNKGLGRLSSLLWDVNAQRCAITMNCPTTRAMQLT